ncbi:restriction endonuclease subunit S [Methanocaldococcus indicus]|uniref:restriction endonuclease subunit S n=1 Tax=Methanocaldococcus indicus TaxID=213231 RepID=UPI003C6D6029
MEFYREENFKEIEELRVPGDWEVKRLEEIAKIIQGFAFKSKEFQKEGIPLLRISNIKKTGKIIFNKEETVYLSEKKLKEIKEDIILKPNDIVIALSGATTGKIGLYTFNYPALLNQRVAKIVANNKIDQLFIYYALFSKSRELLNMANQMAQPNLSYRDLKSIKIPLPPLEEQQAIAKVLNDFDKLIETIEKQIETLNKAKKGMMKKLFTKGVFEHKNFKKTEIGEIPEDWEVVEIKKIFDVKTGTTPSTKKLEYWENGEINWITPLDLSKLKEKIYIENSERKISKIALEKCNLNLIPKGSIIISTRAPVGYVAVLTAESTFNQGCKGLVPKNNDLVNSEFYAYYLKFKKDLLENLSGGSTFKELSKSMLENFKIPLPPLEEQQAIAERLKSIDDLIEIKRKEKEQIEKAKKKVMDLLLTGKIRIRR